VRQLSSVLQLCEVFTPQRTICPHGLDPRSKIATFVGMSTTPRAKIYSPAKTAMQSGKGKTRVWILEYEKPAPATPDALMGWNTMNSTLTQVKLTFATKAQAIAYATAKKLDYSISEPKSVVVQPKAYAENFSTGKRKAWDSSC
jgi:ETC complex I subunit conserved region